MGTKANSNFNFSFKEIQKLVNINYGFTCTLKKLDGEKDFNYRLITKKGKTYYRLCTLIQKHISIFFILTNNIVYRTRSTFSFTTLYSRY